MNLACSTSAFKTDLAGALERVASLGFSYVDLIAIGGWDHVKADRAVADDAGYAAGYAAEIQGLLAKYKLTPVAMNIAVGHPHQRSAEQVAQRKRDVEALARVARRLGISVASFYPGYLAKERVWDEVLADSVQSIREMRAAAGDEGLNLAVELHAMTPFETIEQGAKLLAALPDLPVAYDPSHYAMQGLDVRQTQMFIDRAAHVHLRDAGPGKMQMPTGKGTVDFGWIMEALGRRNYRGPVTIEYLPDLEGGVDASIRELKNRLEAGMWN